MWFGEFYGKCCCKPSRPINTGWSCTVKSSGNTFLTGSSWNIFTSSTTIVLQLNVCGSPFGERWPLRPGLQWRSRTAGMKLLKYLIVFIHFLCSAWHWEIKRVTAKGEGSQREIWLAGFLEHGKRYASSLRLFSVPKVQWVINQLTIHTQKGGADSQQTARVNLSALLIFSQSSCDEYKQSRRTTKISRYSSCIHALLFPIILMLYKIIAHQNELQDTKHAFYEFICFPPAKTRQ